MNTTRSNSNYQPSVERQAPQNEVATQSHYRRRSFISIHGLHYLDQSYQAFIQSCKVDDKQNPQTAERDKDHVDQEKATEKVSDPDGIKQDTNGHLPEDEKEIDPNKEIPEEDNYLVDEEGSIIKEPTREVDDPYRPGHDDEDALPSKQEELPDPKKNTETDF